MTLIVNRNDASYSAPAEKRISHPESAPTMQSDAQTPAKYSSDPGAPSHEVESKLSNNFNLVHKKQEDEVFLSSSKDFEENRVSEVSIDKFFGIRTTPCPSNNFLPPVGINDAESSKNSVSPGFGDELEARNGIKPESARKKGEAPAEKTGNYGYPNTIIADMRDFIMSMKPHKFTKNENAATKLISKFKKTLVCPKCSELHGHTSQGTTSNQYGGTAPHKCRSSVPQLLMMLPRELIGLVGNVHKQLSNKDASLFASWISSSKATHKDEILKHLKQTMEIDYLENEQETSDEELEESQKEMIKTHDTQQVEIVKKVGAFDLSSYSDAEFRSVIMNEMMQMRQRLAALENENKALRQENAVLKKYRPTMNVIAEPKKIPSSTTSLAQNVSYSAVTQVNMPRPIITSKRNRQEVGAAFESTPKSRPQVNLSSFSTTESEKPKEQERSKLVFAYFKGLARRPQSEYRALLDQIGFGCYKARDIIFLSNDFVQILTFENCLEELVEKLENNIPTAKFMKDADPMDPKFYEEHGNLSREFLSSKYFNVMEGSVQRFRKLVTERPALLRTLHFLEKVVATKNTRYEKSPTKPKIFLMNNFMALEQLQDSIKPENSKTIEKSTNDMEVVPVVEDTPVAMETLI